MATRADVEQLNLVIAEAVALCEAAQERFDSIHKELLKAIDEGQRLTDRQVDEEDIARRQVFHSRLRLSERLYRRQQLIDTGK